LVGHGALLFWCANLKDTPDLPFFECSRNYIYENAVFVKRYDPFPIEK
jgi:hypothetical protein